MVWIYGWIGPSKIALINGIVFGKPQLTDYIDTCCTRAELNNPKLTFYTRRKYCRDARSSFISNVYVGPMDCWKTVLYM